MFIPVLINVNFVGRASAVVVATMVEEEAVVVAAVVVAVAATRAGEARGHGDTKAAGEVVRASSVDHPATGLVQFSPLTPFC